MSVIEIAATLIIGFWLFVWMKLSALYVRIERAKKGKSTGGTFKEVVKELTFTGGTSSTFAPIFFFPEANDNEAPKVLKRKRNTWVILFYVVLLAFIAFAITFFENPNKS